MRERQRDGHSRTRVERERGRTMASTSNGTAFSGRDAYAVLGIENGLEATDGEIRKSYRKLALKLHPDKNKGKDAERAAREFDRVQKAYEVLTDEKAKEALDNFLKCQKQRELRFQKENEKRLKMVQELEAKERDSTRTRMDEERAAEQLEKELNRLREKMSRQASSHHPQHQPRGEAPSSPGSKAVGKDGATAAQIEERRRSLKVSWRRAGGADYTVADLRRIFGAFGSEVADVVVRDKGSKCAAIVVLGAEASAWKAAATVCGDLASPLLVVPLMKDPPPPSAAAATATATPNSAGNGRAAPGASFEKDVLARLRAAAALKRKREGDQGGRTNGSNHA